MPFNLHMEYGNLLLRFSDYKVILGGLILVLLFVLVFIKRRSNSLLSFSMLWFLVTLLPQSNLYPINAYMAEHWLYLPSIGFFIILAASLNYLFGVKNLKIFILSLSILLTTFYIFLTIKQNNYWKEPIAFFERTLQFTPRSISVLSNLANEYKKIGRSEDAIVLYKKAIQVEPKEPGAYNDLALIYDENTNYQDAIVFYKKAIEIDPAYFTAYSNLGNTYDNIGRHKEAIEYYKKAIEIEPNYAEAYLNLGIVLYADFDKRDEAITALKKAIEINPKNAEAHNNLAVAYYYKKQYELAVKHCNNATKLGYKVNPDLLKLLEPFREK